MRAISPPRQVALDEAWTPPEMAIGEFYADAVKTIALGLLYGPLWPPAYAFTAGALLCKYLTTTYGIARWYAKPPAVGEELMTHALAFLGRYVLLAHLQRRGAGRKIVARRPRHAHGMRAPRRTAR